MRALAIVVAPILLCGCFLETPCDGAHPCEGTDECTGKLTWCGSETPSEGAGHCVAHQDKGCNGIDPPCAPTLAAHGCTMQMRSDVCEVICVCPVCPDPSWFTDGGADAGADAG